MVAPILFEGNRSFGFYELPNKFGHLWYQGGLNTIDFFLNGNLLITSDDDIADPNFANANIVVTFSGGTIVVGYVAENTFLRAGDTLELRSYTDSSKAVQDGSATATVRPTYTYIEISGDANNGVVRADTGDKSALMSTPLDLGICEELTVSGHSLFVPNISSDFDTVLYKVNGNPILQSDIWIHNNPSTTPTVNPDGSITDNTVYGIWLNTQTSYPFEVSVDRNGETALGECGIYMNGVGFRDAGGFRDGLPTTTIRTPSGIEEPVTLPYTADSVFTVEVTSTAVNLKIDGVVETSYPLLPEITSNKGVPIPSTPQPYLSDVAFSPSSTGVGYISYKLAGSEVRQVISVTSCQLLDDYESTEVDTPITFNVGTNDGDISCDGNVTYHLVGGSHQNGTFQVGIDGRVIFTPDTGFYGLAQADYLVRCDGIERGRATMFVDVVIGLINLRNDLATTHVNTQVNGSLQLNDEICGVSTRTYEVVDPMINGTLTLSNNGSWSYVPNTDFIGVDVAQIKAFCGGDWIGSQSLTISVIPIGSPTIENFDVCTKDCVYLRKMTGTSTVDGDVLIFEFPLSMSSKPVAVGICIGGTFEACGNFNPDSEYQATVITFDGSIGFATIDNASPCDLECILTGIYNGYASSQNGYVKLMEYPMSSSSDPSVAVGIVENGRWEIFSENIQEGTEYVAYTVDISI